VSVSKERRQRRRFAWVGGNSPAFEAGQVRSAFRRDLLFPPHDPAAAAGTAALASELFDQAILGMGVVHGDSLADADVSNSRNLSFYRIDDRIGIAGMEQTAGKLRVIQMAVWSELKGVQALLSYNFTACNGDQLTLDVGSKRIDPQPFAVPSIFYYKIPSHRAVPFRVASYYRDAAFNHLLLSMKRNSGGKPTPATVALG
jgi:hypothetical protein